MYYQVNISRLLPLRVAQSRIHLSLRLLVCWVVAKQLFDQIDVGHDHAAAAVSGETELVHGLAKIDGQLMLFKSL